MATYKEKKKKIFHNEFNQYQKTLFRETMKFLSLEVFKTWLDKGLGNLDQIQYWSCWTRSSAGPA